MKLNEINFNLLSDKELITICIKYDLIKKENISQYTRDDILKIIKIWLSKKLKNYGQKKSPNVKSVAVNRRMSISDNMQKNKIQQQKNKDLPESLNREGCQCPLHVLKKKKQLKHMKEMLLNKNLLMKLGKILKN